MSAWYDSKEEITETEYQEISQALLGRGDLDVERLPPGLTTGPSCRIGSRRKGNVVAGWDVDGSGMTHHWKVTGV